MQAGGAGPQLQDRNAAAGHPLLQRSSYPHVPPERQTGASSQQFFILKLHLSAQIYMLSCADWHVNDSVVVYSDQVLLSRDNCKAPNLHTSAVPQHAVSQITTAHSSSRHDLHTLTSTWVSADVHLTSHVMVQAMGLREMHCCFR